MVDPLLISRALTNVIENALHAMPSGGRLRFSTAPETPGMMDLRVTDTGVGMDAAALGRIFEPYFSTKTTGTGLGLTIAMRNVEANGGRIAVSSERGVGTTVTLSCRWRRSSEASHRVWPVGHASVRLEWALGGHRVRPAR